MATVITLEALADLPPFEVTVEGEPHPGFPDGQPCLYHEWTYGEKAGDGFSISWRGDRSEAPFVVVTPHGRLELSPNKLRPHLAASYTRRYEPGDREEAPPYVREALAEQEAPITVEAYCLAPGRPYWARVDAEHYHLPPTGPGAAPRRRTNLVLLVADAPFLDGEPTRPRTPGMRGWTY